MKLSECQIGDKVFYQNQLSYYIGTVEKINKKTLKIKTIIWAVLLFLIVGVFICDRFLCPSVTKQVGIQFISIYQKSVSPVLSQTGLIHCKYEVTCSEYTKQMIARYGLLQGSLIGFKRILSCR